MPEGCCCSACVSRFGYDGGKEAAKRKRRQLRSDDQPTLDEFGSEDGETEKDGGEDGV